MQSCSEHVHCCSGLTCYRASPCILGLMPKTVRRLQTSRYLQAFVTLIIFPSVVRHAWPFCIRLLPKQMSCINYVYHKKQTSDQWPGKHRLKNISRYLKPNLRPHVLLHTCNFFGHIFFDWMPDICIFLYPFLITMPFSTFYRNRVAAVHGACMPKQMSFLLQWTMQFENVRAEWYVFAITLWDPVTFLIRQ